MRVLVNGFLTDGIFLERGVRQGDFLSLLLYILCAEVLAANIRHDSTIKGFLLPGASGQHFKIGQYADDSTCLVKGLTWVSKMKILGVWFNNGTVNTKPDNWLPRLCKLEANLNLWKSRALSLVGKVLIINVLGASKF